MRQGYKRYVTNQPTTANILNSTYVRMILHTSSIKCVNVTHMPFICLYSMWLFVVHHTYLYVWITLVIKLCICMCTNVHVIYVTWAGVICLKCTHEHEGTQRPRACGDILGKSQLHMLHVMQHFRQMKNRSALYRQGWRFQLQHLEFNSVMIYIYTKQHNRFNCGIEF